MPLSTYAQFMYDNPKEFLTNSLDETSEQTCQLVNVCSTDIYVSTQKLETTCGNRYQAKYLTDYYFCLNGNESAIELENTLVISIAIILLLFFCGYGTYLIRR